MIKQICWNVFRYGDVVGVLGIQSIPIGFRKQLNDPTLRRELLIKVDVSEAGCAGVRWRMILQVEVSIGSYRRFPCDNYVFIAIVCKNLFGGQKCMLLCRTCV